MRELIFLHFGGFGINVGLEFWKLMLIEHGIGLDGRVIDQPIGNPHTIFWEDDEGIFHPRAIFADLDKDIIDKVMKSKV